MSPQSKREYREAVHLRYKNAARHEKTAILDEFCPSWHQKRVVEFGERLCMDVLKKVSHRHFVFSLPKKRWSEFLGQETGIYKWESTSGL
jgi:hypothetical protein